MEVRTRPRAQLSEQRPDNMTTLEGRVALPSIAVVIPAYRACHHIRSVVEGVPSFVARIIVVDDCSPDTTAEIVEELQQRDPRIMLIRHPANQGVGGAMITGYKAALDAGTAIVVKMDADGQMDPGYMLELVTPVSTGRADYTKGNRFLHPRKLVAMPLVRRIGNIGLSFLTKLASGYWNIFDPTNGYTAIHATAINFLDLDRLDRRYFFESSLLIELGLVRAVVKDVYIPAVYQDEKSSLSEAHSLLSFPLKLMAGFLRRVIIQYFVRDFNAVSLLLVTAIPSIIFGLVFGLTNWAHSARTLIPTNTGTVMISILPIILGVQFLLQALTLDVQSVPTAPLHNGRKHSA